MAVTVQAKLRCVAVETHNGFDPWRRVILEPVVADCPENKSWSKWTPSGRVELIITNPPAYEAFEPGREYLASFEAI